MTLSLPFAITMPVPTTSKPLKTIPSTLNVRGRVEMLIARRAVESKSARVIARINLQRVRIKNESERMKIAVYHAAVPDQG
jgi:hypothetical protein